jgi:hypothetical protein
MVFTIQTLRDSWPTTFGPIGTNVQIVYGSGDPSEPMVDRKKNLVFSLESILGQTKY